MSPPGRRDPPLPEEIPLIHARNLLGGAFGAAIAGSVLGLCEAVWLLSTTGAPDLVSPFYAVVLYGLLALPIGAVVGLAISRSRWGTNPGIPWGVGAAVGLFPLGVFVVRYQVNKVVFAEQGVPLTWTLGMVGLFAVIGLVLVGVGALLGRRAPRAVGIRGFAAVEGGMALLTGIVALLPYGENPRAHFAHNEPVPANLASKPNVILIMVDTLRADALGTYGAPNNPTPAIDGLAKDSIVFEKAFSQASWTRASGASLMTSRLPAGHNAALKASRLPDEVTTWAEVMQAGGVATAGFVNNINLSSTFNFQQGYDTFLYEAPEYPFGASESVFSLTLYKVVQKLDERFIEKNHKVVERFYQPAEVVLGDAEAFVSANRGDRWGMFVHLMEPHDPYFEHPSIEGTGPQDYNGKGFSRAEIERPDPTQADYLKRVYGGEVRFLDRRLATFVDWLKNEGLYDDTLIVLTADHGEEFYEHGGWWHGTTLYDEETHIPILVKLPKNRLGGTRVPFTVRSIDIAPTIVAQLGLPPNDKWEGRDLLPDVETMTREVAAAAVPPPPVDPLAPPVAPPAPNPCAPYRHPLDRVVVAQEDFEGNVLSSIREGGYKYATANEGNPRGLPTTSLFDVVADPKELTNLAGGSEQTCDGKPVGDAATAMKGTMEATISASASGASHADDAAIGDAQREALKALGYLGDDEGK
jgi:arylsulfatase A-like enzyme